MLQKLVRFFF